jgi:fibronectin-binding autotransporter adhesin
MKPTFNPFLCCAFTLCAVLSSHAASFSWDGTSSGAGAQGGAGTWDSNTTANWWDGTNNVVWPNSGTNNDAVFSGTASLSVLVSGTVTVNDISIARDYKVGADSSGTIILNGATPTITTTGSGNFATIGSIIDGSAGLSKAGTVTLELRGANIYTGDTRVLNGTLLMGSANNRLPTGTTLILGDGVANTSGVFQMNLRSQQVAGLQTAGNGTGNRIINGNSVASIFTVNNTTDQTFSGILGGTGTNHNNFALTKSGAATLILTNTNTYTGATAIRNGNLALTGGDDRLLASGAVVLGDVLTTGKLVLGDATTARNQTLAGLTTTGSGGSVVGAAAANSVLTMNNASGTNTFSGKLGGSGTNENNLALIKNGAGTLVLAGDSSFAGDITVNAGKLTLTHSNALGTGTKNFFMQGTSRILDISNNITLSDSITLNASTNSGDGAGIVNSSGTNEIKGRINITTGNGVLNISSAAGTLTASGDITATTTTRALILGGASVTANTISGLISDGSTLNMPVTKQGVGNWVLANANTYSGDTKITGGTLTLGNNLAIQNSAFDTSGAGAMVLSGTATPTFGGLKGSTDLATAISSGYGTVTDLTLNPATGTSHTYGGAITNGSGNTTLTKKGAGTQILSGTNLYAGATQINQGKLLIGTGGSLANTAVTVGGATATGTPTLGGVGTISGATVIAAAGAGAAGIHAPGIVGVDGGVGKQAISSDLSYGSGSIFEWDINGNTTGSRGAAGGFDAVDGTGTLTVDATASTGTIFRIVLGAGVDLGDSFWDTPYTVKTWSDIFSGFTLASGSGFDTSNIQVTGQDISGVGSFSITGTSLTWTAVPEPTTALAGLLLTAGLLRRRRG